MASIKFISEDDFQKGAEEEREKNKVCHWGELKKEVIFVVLKAELIKHKTYDSYILHIQDKEANQFKVWCPKGLAVKVIDERPPKHNCFISSLGVEEIEGPKGVSKKYLYDYTYKFDSNAVKDYFS